jgi:hypothetical protein
MFPQSSSPDFNAGFQHQRLWDQIAPEDGLLALAPEVGALQHHGEEDPFANQVELRVWRAVRPPNGEDLMENKVPLRLWRVLDKELHKINVRGPERRRPSANERREGAAKRFKVYSDWRRKKRKVSRI